jgi:hypothetical protein
MSLFFFHLIGAREVEDTEGMTLTNPMEARNHARVVAAELAKNNHDKAKGQAILIVDENGCEVSRVPLD